MGKLREEQRAAAYLHDHVQDHLLSLVFAVAQVAVCVDIVGVAVQLDVHVVRTSLFVLDCEGDLGGGSSQVHGADGLRPLRLHVSVPQVFLQNIQSYM